MMSRMKLLLAVGLVLFPVTLFALPQVAVLDAAVLDDMDSSVVVPITDKISEEMVNSGKYTVLDRAGVEQVLKEKEFQLSSGLVKTEEIRKAGEYLGADFVVAARASKVGNTWFLSARMIDVKTGAITAQTSVEQQGNIDVLLRLAKAAGTRLAGGMVEKVAEARLAAAGGEEKPAVKTKTVKKPATQTQTAAAAPARWVVGAKLGAASANMYGDETFSTINYAGLRYAAGAYTQLALTRALSLEAGLSFVQKGFEEDFIILGEDATLTYTFNYLETPVLAKFRLHSRSGFYAGLGAFAAMLLGANYNLHYEVSPSENGDLSDDFFELGDLDLGLLLSLGFDIPIRSGLLLNVEARSAISFATWYGDTGGYTPKHATVTILAGLGWPVGR